MEQDCTLWSAWMGHCHWSKMVTGEVIVGIVGAFLTLVGLGVAIWQIRKQEQSTRDQLEKQEELTREQIDAMMEATRKQIDAMMKTTREQIAATMEATQKQLEEMRKAQEPGIDIIFDCKNGKLIIDLFNCKTVPVPVKDYIITILWESGEFGGQTCAILSNEFERLGEGKGDGTKILNVGESYKLTISTEFIRSIFECTPLEFASKMANKITSFSFRSTGYPA